MATIEDMPNEILHNFLSHLGSKEFTATSLVSHRFHMPSQSALYKQPWLRIDDKYSCRVSVRLFLRTLLLAPHGKTLAGYVRMLTVDIDYEPNSTPPSPDIIPMTTAASNLGFDDHPLSEQGTQIIVLLSLLPHLTSLLLWGLRDSHTTIHNHFFDALKRRTTLPIGLQNISQFLSISDYSITAVTPEILVLILGLPAIRKITVSITNEPHEATPFIAAATTAGTSLVTDINVWDANIAIQSLEAIMKIPKALTRFSFTCASVCQFYEIGEFGRVFMPLQRSIEYLYLDFERLDNFGGEEALRQYGRLESLRGWNALHTIDCTLMALIGGVVEDAPCLEAVLPLGLRSLVIHEDWCWTVDQMVDQLVALLERAMIALQELKVVLWIGRGVAAATEDRLRQACHEAHVVFLLDWAAAA